MIYSNVYPKYCVKLVINIPIESQVLNIASLVIISFWNCAYTKALHERCKQWCIWVANTEVFYIMHCNK